MTRIHPAGRTMVSALTLVLAVILVGGAAAQGQKRDAFDRRDTNSDGVITQQEWTASGEKAVRRLDSDGDGRISRAEFMTFQKQRVDRMSKRLFRRADKRGVDHITLSTIRRERFRARLKRFDADGDGKVTRSEFRAVFMQRTTRRMTRLFKRFDKDGDGLISKAERKTMNERRFGRLDSDGNGRLTRAELTAARQRVKAKAGAKSGRGSGKADSAGPKKPESYRKP